MSQEDPKNLKVTPVSEIKEKSKKLIVEGIPTELPSGVVVVLGRPSLTKMLKDGVIPGNLIQAALNQMQNKVPMTAEEIKASISVTELLVLEAIKSMKVVVENPKEDELGLYENFTDDDRGFIFQYVQAGGTDLTPFRPKQ
jgi:hypothetical protein